jgi:hypothetical protein
MGRPCLSVHPFLRSHIPEIPQRISIKYGIKHLNQNLSGKFNFGKCSSNINPLFYIKLKMEPTSIFSKRDVSREIGTRHKTILFKVWCASSCLRGGVAGFSRKFIW